MAPGGRNYQDIGDSQSAYDDYCVAPENAKFNNYPFRIFAAVTGGMHGAGSISAAHELLECPVCMNLMYPPIHQCPNGHPLCMKCKSKVHVCPTCHHELGNIKCLALEKIAESLELPCQYQIYGCQDIFPYHTRLLHEQDCRFRPYKADMRDGCTYNHRYVKSNAQEVENATWMLTEKIAESLELPCQYQIYGCQDVFTYHTRLLHEQDCRFRPYNCPYVGCESVVTGDIQYLVAHLKYDHKVDMHDGCTFNHRYVKSNAQEVENAIWMLTVFNYFVHQFCLHFEAFNLGLAPVYMAFLHFMGDDDDAKGFRYSLEVDGFGRKLTWEGVPRSIRDSHKTVRDSLDGLIIQRSTALFFSGGDREELKLKVAGCIWREPL